MRKIEGVARFASEQDAQQALARLAQLRHDDGNELDGGAADLRNTADGSEIRFSYRVRRAAAKGVGDKLGSQIQSALQAGEVELSHGAVEYDEETYVDRDSGQVRSHQANRVVQTYTDEDGQQKTRVLTTKTRLVRAIDDETGEEVGKVAVRTVTDEHGNKVVFEGDKGVPEQNVIVETGK
jgi:hypothetical protein